MIDVYIDPNYDPTATYWQIEGLLLLFNKVFVYAPNAHAIQQALEESSKVPVSPDRLLCLAERDLITPVAASRYWSKEWRDQKSEDLRSSNRDRSEFFRWTTFDSAICGLPNKKPLDFYRFGETARNLSSDDPDTFAMIKSKVATLRQSNRLPAQFYESPFQDWSDDQVCEELLYNFGNDVGVAYLTNANAIMLSEKQKPLYEIYCQLFSDLTWIPKNVLVQSGQSDDWFCSPNDYDIARDFANRLASDYDLLPVLEEYRQSNFCHLFQLFVATGIQELEKEGYKGKSLVAGLLSRFNKRAEDSEQFGDIAGNIVGAAAGAALVDFINNPAAKNISEKLLPRRRFLIHLGGAATGAALGPLFLKNVFQDAKTTFTEHDAWISLIARAPKKK